MGLCLGTLVNYIQTTLSKLNKNSNHSLLFFLPFLITNFKNIFSHLISFHKGCLCMWTHHLTYLIPLVGLNWYKVFVPNQIMELFLWVLLCFLEGNNLNACEAWTTISSFIHYYYYYYLIIWDFNVKASCFFRHLELCMNLISFVDIYPS